MKKTDRNASPKKAVSPIQLVAPLAEVVRQELRAFRDRSRDAGAGADAGGGPDRALRTRVRSRPGWWPETGRKRFG